MAGSESSNLGAVLDLQRGADFAELRFVRAESEVFAEGWLTPNGEYLGRPVDFLTLRDGSLLVSDDDVGAIYRITYAP